MATIKPEQLTQEIGEILQTFNHSVQTIVDEAAVEVGKAGAADLRRISPRGYRGKYAKGWTWKKTKRGTVYIHNARHYQLTHLLEKGHKTVKKSGKYGNKSRTAAIPHISTIENEVAENFESRIVRGIQYQK